MDKLRKCLALPLLFIFCLTNIFNNYDVVAKDIQDKIVEDKVQNKLLKELNKKGNIVDEDQDTKRIIIKYKDGANRDKVKEELNTLSIKKEEENVFNSLISFTETNKNKISDESTINKVKTIKEFKDQNAEVIEVEDTGDLNYIISNIQKNDDVLYIQEDYKLYIQADDPLYNLQWGLKNTGQEVNGMTGVEGVDIGIEEVWDGLGITAQTTTSQAVDITTSSAVNIENLDKIETDTTTKSFVGFTIGILDTGIDINHEDIKDNIYTNANEIPNNGIDDDNNGYVDDIHGWDFYNDDQSVYDNENLDDHGTHVAGIISASHNNIGIKGIAPNAKIMPLKFINGNYGYTSDLIEAIEYAKEQGVEIINCSFGGYEENPLLKDVMSNSGIIFVSSAGNDKSIQLTYPSAYELDNIISVGAIDSTGQIYSTSNYGEEIDVWAPGSNIISTMPENEYGYKNGTSVATPHVTGLIALLKEYNQEWSFGEITQSIKNIDKDGIFRVDDMINVISDGIEDINSDEGVIEYVMSEEDEEVYTILLNYSNDNIPEDVLQRLSDLIKLDVANVQRLIEEGLSLNEIVKLANVSEYIQLPLEVVREHVKDSENIPVNLLTLKSYKDSFQIPDHDYENISKYLLQEYDPDNILGAYIVSSILNADIEKLLIAIEQDFNSFVTVLDTLDIEDEYRNQLLMFLNQYPVNLNYLLEFISDNNIDTFVSELLDYLNDQKDMMGLYQVMEDDESYTFESDYNKYVSSPYDVNKISSDDVNLNKGNLEYNHKILSLPGRNGLDADLKLNYSSADANLSDTYIYSYVPHNVMISCIVTRKDANGLYTIFAGFETETVKGLKPSAARALEREYNDTKYKDDLKFEYTAGILFSFPIQAYSQNRTTNITPTESIYNIGNGWMFNIPYIEINRYGTFDAGELGSSEYEDYMQEKYYSKHLHLRDGKVYSLDDSYNLHDYNLKDMVLCEDSSYSHEEEQSKYALTYKDGRIDYFSETGALIGELDRYGNEIRYFYEGIRLKKIIDSLDRETTFQYETINNELTTTIIPPDNNPIQLISEEWNSDLLLKKIIDAKGREVAFDYQVQNTQFNLFDKERLTKSLSYANLTDITYPTGVNKKYNYELTKGNLGDVGASTYYRITETKDVIEELDHNQVTYSYTNNYTDDIEYSTTVNYGNGLTEINTFNSEHLKTQIENKDSLNNTLLKVNTTYNSYKLPTNSETQKFNTIGDSETTYNESWSYNNYGDVLTYIDKMGVTSTFTYDSTYHQLESIEKEISPGIIMKEEYGINSSNGNVEWKKQHHSQDGHDNSIMTYYDYDQYGNLIEDKLIRQDGTEVIKNFNYSSAYKYAYLTNESITVTDYEGNIENSVKSYTYDFDTGRNLSVTDGNSHTEHYEYDILGRKIKIINPDNTEKIISYDDNNNTVTFENEADYRLKVAYDPLGREIQLLEETSNGWVLLKEMSYHTEFSAKLWEKDAFGNKTTYSYDELSRPIKTIFPDNTFARVEYYDGENKTIEYNEEGHKVTKVFDANENVISETAQINDNVTSTSTYEYNNNGNQTKTIDPNGNEILFEYNNLGQLVKVVDDLNQITQYDYDYLGNMTTITYPNGSKITKEYDELGRLIKQTDALGHVEKIKYDPVGNKIVEEDRNGIVANYTYDNLNRTILMIKGNQRVEYTYTSTGSVDTITNAEGTTTFTYNNDGTLKQKTLPDGKSINYHYNLNKQVQQSVDYFSNSIIYTYDNRNRMETVLAGADMTQYEYYLDGSLKKVTYPNGMTANYEYDYANRVTTLTNNKAANILINEFSYTYDLVGNQLSKTSSEGTTQFTYDELNRIKEVVEPSTAVTTYSYDNNSNILSIVKNGIDAQQINFTYNPSNQLIEKQTTIGNNIETFKFAYDKNGNLIYKQKEVVEPVDPLKKPKIEAFVIGEQINANLSGTAHLEYNELNQLISYKDLDGTNTTYTYDNEGFRQSKKINDQTLKFYYDNGLIINEETNGALSARNTYGLQLISRWDQQLQDDSYYLFNGHNDVVNIVDENQEILNVYDYDIYGKSTKVQENTLKNPLRYTGQYHDEETGMYYLRARYYDPDIMRFISEDTYEGEYTNPLSLNYYIYCVGNPISLMDTSGNSPIHVYAAIAPLIKIFDDRFLSGIKSQYISPVQYMPSNDMQQEPVFRSMNLPKYTGDLAYDAGSSLGSYLKDKTVVFDYSVSFSGATLGYSKLHSVQYGYQADYLHFGVSYKNYLEIKHLSSVKNFVNKTNIAVPGPSISMSVGFVFNSPTPESYGGWFMDHNVSVGPFGLDYCYWENGASAKSFSLSPTSMFSYDTRIDYFWLLNKY